MHAADQTETECSRDGRPFICNNVRVGCVEGNEGTVSERLPARSQLVPAEVLFARREESRQPPLKENASHCLLEIGLYRVRKNSLQPRNKADGGPFKPFLGLSGVHLRLTPKLHPLKQSLTRISCTRIHPTVACEAFVKER
jgi:hypothetical protein